MVNLFLTLFYAVSIVCLTAAVWSAWINSSNEARKDRALRKINRNL
jgi:hypothetical protein